MLFITIIIGHWSSVAGYLVIRHFALVSWAWSAVREYCLSVFVKPLSFRGPWTIDENFQKDRAIVIMASTVPFSASRRNIRERGATVPSLLPALAIQLWRMHFRIISVSCKKGDLVHFVPWVHTLQNKNAPGIVTQRRLKTLSKTRQSLPS